MKRHSKKKSLNAPVSYAGLVVLFFGGIVLFSLGFFSYRYLVSNRLLGPRPATTAATPSGFADAQSIIASARSSEALPGTNTGQGESPMILPTASERPATGKNRATRVLGAEDFTIPIIMYHYIRTPDPVEDPAGVSLSVSPEHFRSQLDDLRKKGYQTTTFADVVAGNIPAKPVILTFDDGYQNFYDNAYPELRMRSMKAVMYAIADFHTDWYLTNGELNEIAQYGIEIGSHTLNHRDVTKLTPAELTKELVQSKQELQQVTGLPIISFAYPFGAFNKKAEENVEAAGYTYAVTTQGALASFGEPFALPRFRAADSTTLKEIP